LRNAAIRRYEAANWLRRIVGVVCAKDLAEEPSEEEFRLGLRNGIILCNALNKVQPGAVPKVAFLSFRSVYIVHHSLFCFFILHAKYEILGCGGTIGFYCPCRWCSSMCISIL